jgi:hypothetical protein
MSTITAPDVETPPGRTARLKLGVAGIVTTVFVLGTAAMAGATPAPAAFDPGAEASTVFTDNWSLALDLVKVMAPIAIGAGLVLLAIRKVVGSLSKGRAPTRI